MTLTARQEVRFNERMASTVDFEGTHPKNGAHRAGLRTHTAYLTGVSSPLTREAARWDLGMLISPANSTHRQVAHYELVGADNGCFVESKKGIPFDADRWLTWLRKTDPAKLLWAALPDVLKWVTIDTPKGPQRIPVGDKDATIERGGRYVDTLCELGYTPALVAQDGLVQLDEVPWISQVGAVFIGGSDEYKLGPVAADIVRQANERGLWTHAGRVNSWMRLNYFHKMETDSADGTYLFRAPKVCYPKLIDWLDRLSEDPWPGTGDDDLKVV